MQSTVAVEYKNRLVVKTLVQTALRCREKFWRKLSAIKLDFQNINLFGHLSPTKKDCSNTFRQYIVTETD